MAENPPTAAVPKQILFHYVKSSDYREVACHGAIGNITPQGKIWFALYAERPPLPRIVGYNLPTPIEGATSIKFDEHAAGTPVLMDSRQGIIRQVELSAYLDIEVAEKLQKWLGDRIAEYRSNIGAVS